MVRPGPRGRGTGPVLQVCAGQVDRGLSDLEAFADSAPNRADLPDLVREAERRLRRLGKAPRQGTTTPKRGTTAPRRGTTAPDRMRGQPGFTLAVSGGYQLAVSDGAPHHYGLAALDASVGLVGPVRLRLEHVHEDQGDPPRS